MEKETRTPIQIKRELRDKLKELKPLLPRGTFQEVAEKLDLKPAYISDVSVGRRWDLNVIEELLKIGEQNLKRVLKAEKKLDELTEKRKAAR